MYNLLWDPETGGIVLTTDRTDATVKIPPRPVFWEELDMLGLEKHGWHYPKVQTPIMWACNKQYYYRGELLFEAKGANVFDNPTLEFSPNVDPTYLEPIDMRTMLEKNKGPMFSLEREAMDFIREQYTQYASTRVGGGVPPNNEVNFSTLCRSEEKEKGTKHAIVKLNCSSFDIMPVEEAKLKRLKIYLAQKIDVFVASFSGGKDSQVVLDLCTKVIPPHAFQVIYSDTGYELPTSLKLYEEIQKIYKRRYPDLKFSVAKNHESVLHYWDEIGTPSNTHRWCCSVMKTSPLYRLLKADDNKQPYVLTFEGVRAEESTRRAKYGRIGVSVKHSTVVNASPILHWNTTEVFLYLFRHRLPINQAYRNGMTRVGCLICPFSSEWNDMVSRRFYGEQLAPFMERIEKATRAAGIPDVEVYIKKGNWKHRAGGRGMNFPSELEIISQVPVLEVKLSSPQKKPLTWLNAVSPFHTNIDEKGNIYGELRYKRNLYRFEVEKRSNTYLAKFYGTEGDPTLQKWIKRALYKATYCINCESCDVECSTGALTILPDVKIDTSKCVHCRKCLDFHALGCIVADSLSETGNTQEKAKPGTLPSYNNFGLRSDWVKGFFDQNDAEAYFKENKHGLNVKEQLPPFVKWLVQAEIIDSSRNKQLTFLGSLLAELFTRNKRAVWEIIWINLTYNAPIATWYMHNIKWGETVNNPLDDISIRVWQEYPSKSLKTVKNVVYAFMRTLEETPLGQLGLFVKKKGSARTKGKVSNITNEAVVYSLYKYSKARGINTIRVTDLYNLETESGLYKEFGIEPEELRKTLLGLSLSPNRVLVANMVMGLDHVTLREELTPEQALEILINS